MKKLSAFWIGYASLVLITACVRKDEPLAPGPEELSRDEGAAELLLPALPKGFLAKRSSDSVDVMFQLTVSGPGMEDRWYSWTLDSAARPVKVTGIPVGSRLFTGRLAIGGFPAYSDSAWALIEKGKTALVHLKLGSTTGDARICVEIEGFPLPEGCLREPDPTWPDVGGCWRILYLGDDSTGRDSLRILQEDSLLQGEIRWRDGRRDSARGMVNRLGGVVFGSGDSSSAWLFSGEVDSIGKFLRGKFYLNRSPMPPVRILTAAHTLCAYEPPPPPPEDSTLVCWDVGQVVDGKSATGRFLVLERRDNLYGLFQWTGYTAMSAHGYKALVPATAVPAYYLYTALPPGLANPPQSRPDSVHYKGQIMDTAIVYGTVNGNLGQRGQWKGSRSTCLPGDLRTVLGAHRL